MIQKLDQENRVKDTKFHDEDKDGNKTRINISIFGDSMSKHIARFVTSKHNNIFVFSHPGTTTEDLIDYMKHSVHKKPDVIITHIRTNN